MNWWMEAVDFEGDWLFTRCFLWLMACVLPNISLDRRRLVTEDTTTGNGGTLGERKCFLLELNG